MKKVSGIKLFAAIVITIVLAFVVISFFLIGSPQNQRLQRFDDQRSNNLQTLERMVLMSWEEEGDLPESLTELAEERYQEEALNDPESGDPYHYDRLGENQFEFCANFALEKENQRDYLNTKYDYVTRSESYFTHSAGEQCYTIELDREAYERLENANRVDPFDLPPVAY